MDSATCISVVVMNISSATPSTTFPVMKRAGCPYIDPEFDALPERINGPTCRVCIDNESVEDCTIVKVDSLNKQGLLLEVVQILTEMNLSIAKGYISCDAGWFMDVFHVKDEHSHKLTDQKVINSIQQAIGTTTAHENSANDITYTHSILRSDDSGDHTAIEITGADRPGLFSEISAALADLSCNVVEAHAWSHNARLACVAHISDQSTDTPIEDPNRLATIEEHLSTVLRAAVAVSQGWTHTHQEEVKTSSVVGGDGAITTVERRLHQLMMSIGDYDCNIETMPTSPKSEDEFVNTVVKVESCADKGYSIVSIECKDRPRLMFDTVCTLTDLHYVIFHASIRSEEGYSLQEYFIRREDGYTLSEHEKQKVIKCMKAGIERRICEGVKLELSASNRAGLLSDITRALREKGLNVVRADVATQGEQVRNAFYIKDITGEEVDLEKVETIKKEMGATALKLKGENSLTRTLPLSIPRNRLSFGDILKSQIERISHNFVATMH